MFLIYEIDGKFETYPEDCITDQYSLSAGDMLWEWKFN